MCVFLYKLSTGVRFLGARLPQSTLFPALAQRATGGEAGNELTNELTDLRDASKFPQPLVIYWTRWKPALDDIHRTSQYE